MPNGITKLERLQREFTQAYKEQIELYRNARILWAVITREGYIIVANPHWSELGYEPDRLHFVSMYTLFPDQSKFLNMMLNVHSQTVAEQPIQIQRADGKLADVLCWLSAFVERSSGSWVARFAAVLRDE